MSLKKVVNGCTVDVPVQEKNFHINFLKIRFTNMNILIILYRGRKIAAKIKIFLINVWDILKSLIILSIILITLFNIIYLISIFFDTPLLDDFATFIITSIFL